jgi:hypothetical protein
MLLVLPVVRQLTESSFIECRYHMWQKTKL